MGLLQVRCRIGSGRGERSANWVLQVRCRIGSGRGKRSANGVPQVRCQIGRQMSEFLFQRNIGCHLGSPWARFAAMSRTIRSIGRDFV